MSETKGRRVAMDRFTKQLVQAGTNHEYAKKKARECAIRADRKDEKQRTKTKTKG